MSLLGSESWDLITPDAAHVTDYWTTSGNVTIIPGAGRCGTAGLMTNTIGGLAATIGVNATTPGGYMGHALFIDTMVNPSQMSVQSADGTIQLMVRGQPDGSYVVQTGPTTVLGTILGSTPPGLWHLNRYHHLGFEWVLGDVGVGSAKVYVDGVLWFSITGVKTTSGPFSVPSTVWKLLDFRWRGVGDDHYWGDAAGAAPWNAFLGDLRVEGQVALTDAVGGGGFYREFTPSTGTDHGALMDEIPPNDNTDFTSGDLVNLRETVKFPNITLATGSVLGVQLMPNVIKTLSGDRQIACLMRRGGVDALGTNQGVAQTQYTYRAQMFQVDPTTGLAWSAATANAAEGGIQITI